jgi:hypothetical protein
MHFIALKSSTGQDEPGKRPAYNSKKAGVGSRTSYFNYQDDSNQLPI